MEQKPKINSKKKTINRHLDKSYLNFDTYKWKQNN